ncbi:MAG: prepilin-type N-terminal cleavage/methylation domain-containing protein [Pedosphaera sp.]|nr:prepilin-type N-terminal cleavage/methylation domain-containing protein [Pedosphaera sp.]
MKTSTERGRAGFTLIEVVIAIGLLTMVVMAMYQTWSAVLRATEAGSSAAAQVQRERVALNTIEEALGGVRMFEQNIAHYGFFVDTTNLEYPVISFVSRLPESFLGGKHFPNQPLRRVHFEVRDGLDSRMRELVMTQSPVLAIPDDVTVRKHQTVLAAGIDQFYVEFWSTAVEDWINEWPSTNGIPQRLRLMIALKRKDGEPALSEDIQYREFSLSAIPVTKDVQNPDPKTRRPSRTPSAGGGGPKK